MRREIITFTDTVTNRRQKRVGYRIGDYLATGGKYSYRVYNFRTGKPVIDAVFTTAEEAVVVAERLDKIYGEYFPIWDTEGWEEVNIFSLLRFTIPNGVEHYKYIEELSSA